MYSGSDSTESQNYTQWALNPQSYQNVSNEHVDWAALAQQWIIMKEAGPPPVQHGPAAAQHKPKRDVQGEGGEAPMDVENDKEDDVPPPWTNINVPPPGDSWSWNAQQQQWGWNNSWTAPPNVPPPKPPLLPTPSTYNQFPASPEVVAEPANYSGYNSASSSDYNSGYWNANSKTKPHNKRFSKVNPPRQPVVPETITLDAAKRKQLPAWIREGLEKMERDKQKQLEKEREKQENEAESDKIKLSEKDALEIIKSTVREQRSKYESDNDSDGEDADTNESELRGKTPEPAPLTQEELMLKVRRTMTEILLNVTNREIQQICKEELQRYINKNKASDDRLSAPSGSNFSAKLGLGIYGGDSGSSSEDSEDDAKQDNKDSDSELRETIRRRKAEFSKIEREIEEKLAVAEKTGDDQSRGASPETNDNDSQVDAKYQGRKRHSSSERTPPIKIKIAPHELKRRSRKSSSYSDESNSDHERNKSRRSRKSSSSESSCNGRHRRSRRSNESKETSKASTRRSRSVSRRRSHSRSRRDSYHSQYSRRSRSRSHSRSKRSRSKSKSRHKSSRSKRTKSRSRSRQRRSRSRSSYRRRSRSRRRSSSSSRKSYHRRRSRSSSSGRGKRSHRH